MKNKKRIGGGGGHTLSKMKSHKKPLKVTTRLGLNVIQSICLSDVPIREESLRATVTVTNLGVAGWGAQQRSVMGKSACW